jgi:hypothetical protein
MVRQLWFGRPVRGLSGGSNGSKRRYCASVKSLRFTPAMGRYDPELSPFADTPRANPLRSTTKTAANSAKIAG